MVREARGKRPNGCIADILYRHVLILINWWHDWWSGSEDGVLTWLVGEFYWGSWFDLIIIWGCLDWGKLRLWTEKMNFGNGMDNEESESQRLLVEWSRLKIQEKEKVVTKRETKQRLLGAAYFSRPTPPRCVQWLVRLDHSFSYIYIFLMLPILYLYIFSHIDVNIFSSTQILAYIHHYKYSIITEIKPSFGGIFYLQTIYNNLNPGFSQLKRNHVWIKFFSMCPCIGADSCHFPQSVTKVFWFWSASKATKFWFSNFDNIFSNLYHFFLALLCISFVYNSKPKKNHSFLGKFWWE